MATTGTTNFTLDFAEIAEEAWERAGKEMRTGYQLRTARRSMNMLLIEWVNRGVNLWTLDEGTINLTAGVSDYDLPADTVGVLEYALRENDGDTQTQRDVSLYRIGVAEYANIANKLQQGRPQQVLIRRERDFPRVTFWPIPETSSYTFIYWRMRRLEDAGDGVETPDMPFRFLPALVAGLAYYIALKDPEMMPRVEMLKMEYEEQYKRAAAEDRERATMRLVPKIGHI